MNAKAMRVIFADVGPVAGVLFTTLGPNVTAEHFVHATPGVCTETVLCECLSIELVSHIHEVMRLHELRCVYRESDMRALIMYVNVSRAFV